VAAFIAAQREAHGIPQAVSCRALGVSQSWSCKWRNGELPPRAARRERLKAEVARLFALHRGTYASPRVTAHLKAAGWRVSENTVAGLMREQGLAARGREAPPATTRPGRGRTWHRRSARISLDRYTTTGRDTPFLGSCLMGPPALDGMPGEPEVAPHRVTGTSAAYGSLDMFRQALYLAA
jgi:hypothetical protein